MGCVGIVILEDKKELVRIITQVCHFLNVYIEGELIFSYKNHTRSPFGINLTREGGILHSI